MGGRAGRLDEAEIRCQRAASALDLQAGPEARFEVFHAKAPAFIPGQVPKHEEAQVLARPASVQLAVRGAADWRAGWSQEAVQPLPRQPAILVLRLS